MQSGRLVTLAKMMTALVFMSWAVPRTWAGQPPPSRLGIPWGVRDSNARKAKSLTPGAEPSLSPDGHSVAFTRNGTSIWIMDLRTLRIRLLGNYGNAHSPTWDPSGRRIAFSGNAGKPDSYGIWIVDRDGMQLHKLPGGDSDDQYPLWSPNGKWIAWSRRRRLWMSDTTGVEKRALTTRPAREFEFPLSWSGDGSVLLYAASDAGPDYELRLIGYDGSGQRTDPTGIVSGFPGGVQWSPDGDSIYQSLWALTPGLAITEHRAGGKSRTVLVTLGNASVGKLAIAPDQSFIIYDNAEPEGAELISLLRLR